MLQPPVVGEFGGLGIDAGGEPREIGGAQRGGFLDHRAIDRQASSAAALRFSLHANEGGLGELFTKKSPEELAYPKRE